MDCTNKKEDRESCIRYINIIDKLLIYLQMCETINTLKTHTKIID